MWVYGVWKKTETDSAHKELRITLGLLNISVTAVYNDGDYLINIRKLVL